MSIAKVFLFLWPFVKEMVLGDKTVADAAKDNKIKLMIAFIIVGSLGANMLTIHRLWTMSEEYLALKKEYAMLAQKTTKPIGGKVEHVVPARSDNDPSPEKDPIQSISPPKKPRLPKPHPPTVVDDTAERYNKLREDFEKIKNREEKYGSA